jgi:uronate dehydrogenase
MYISGVMAMQNRSQKLLITSASTRLSRHLASSLERDYEVRLTDRDPVAGARNFTVCDLNHGEATNELVRGMDAIVHSGESDPTRSVSEQLDVAMRCTYNLLQAASDEGVPRVIFLSSLSLMDQYDEHFVVTEGWRAVPTTEAASLAHHLGEFVCREFARERRTEVVCLRLGQLAWDGEPTSTSALYPDDAAQAVERVLSTGRAGGIRASTAGWTVLHIQSAVPNARFLTTAARDSLGYEPSPR